MTDIDKPDPEPEPWERAALDVPMTLSDIAAVRAAFEEAGHELPENMEAAMVRAYVSLDFLRALSTGGYRAFGP